ncbi:hypothetical protein EWM64_g7107 [Hericium alpestre]|uniref:Uncharacterized protein n=1 Tax=Hericium alpestre TaxID=135208 RepID=A0A4Y9ZPS9_9AGAM|nr:hypothetical protein EWM64_g7107 [Hericium alpestre]
MTGTHSTKRKAPATSDASKKKAHTTLPSSFRAPSVASCQSQQASVASEEDEHARLEAEGVDEVEEFDSEGNLIHTYAVSPDDAAEAEPEDDEAELKHMSACWTSPMYAFFDRVPTIDYVKDRKCHIFKCSVKGCRQTIRHYLDTGDAQSTGNMHKHVKKCWGEDVLYAAIQTGNEYDRDLNFATDAWSSPNH